MKRIAAIFIAVLLIVPAIGFAGGIVYDAQGNAYFDPGGGAPLVDIHSGPRAAQQEAQRQQMEQQRQQMQRQQYQLEQQRQQQMQRQQHQRMMESQRQQRQWYGD